MTRHDYDFGSRRRTFLKTVGVLGTAAAAGPVAASDEESDGGSGSLDDYHRTLRDQLTAASRQQRQLPAGSYVFGTTEAAAIDAFSLRGGGEATTVAVETDAVPITTAQRLDVPGSTGDPADVRYAGRIEDHSFDAGDLLLAVVYVRSDADDAELTASFRYEDTGPDGDASDSESFVQRGETLEPTGEWMRYFVPIEVGEQPGGTDHVPLFELRAGYGEQTVDVGGIALFDYGDSDVSLGTLPPYDYEGRSEDAEWREAARERIEEIRKTDVEVEVLNPGGRPMNGADVDVEMVDHEFDFGSAVSVEHLVGTDEDDRIYRETFREHFNKAVVENGMKFPAWEGEWDIAREDTRAALEWLDERDVPTRGHYLLWEQYGNDSGGGMSIEDPDALSADEIRRTVTEKIRDLATEFEEQVTEWDVHNHPVWQSNFRDADGLGWDAVDEWWAAANEATDHELYTNEMGAIGGAWQRSQYYDYVTHLVENDYPIDGIGFMGHHQQQYNQLLDVENMIAGFDEFSEFGLPLLVTEFDIQIFDRRNAQDVALQRDYLRDFLTVAFSKEAVEGVVSWGFWEDDHWRPTGAYYDADWTLREHGETFLELVFEEWWTEESGETDGDGVYSTRGFEGTYAVSAEKGALSGETTVAVDDETGTVTVELTPPSGGDSDGDEDEDGPPFGRDDEAREEGGSHPDGDERGPPFGKAHGRGGRD